MCWPSICHPGGDRYPMRIVFRKVHRTLRENLGTHCKLSVILTVGDEEIKEPVIIVVPPGNPTATTRHQVVNTCHASHVGEGPILIIPVKIIRSFSHGITPGIDHVQVQVTVVIKVSPYRRAVIAEGIVQRLLRCLIIDEMPPRAFGC